MDAICRRHFQLHFWKRPINISIYIYMISYNVSNSTDVFALNVQLTKMSIDLLVLAWNKIGDRPSPLTGKISQHYDVIKSKHFPRYWPFVPGIHRSPVNSPRKGQWHAALLFSSICAWINDWVNNRKAGDLRRHRDHYDVIVIKRNEFMAWIINYPYINL